MLPGHIAQVRASPVRRVIVYYDNFITWLTEWQTTFASGKHTKDGHMMTSQELSASLADVILVDKMDGAIYHNNKQLLDRGADVKNMISFGDLYKNSFMYAKINAMAEWVIANDIHDIKYVEEKFG